MAAVERHAGSQRVVPGLPSFGASDHLGRMTDSDVTMRTSADRVDRILSLCAGIAAITAVAVSLYQAALARRQLRASAWPYVTQDNTFTLGSPYMRRVSNQGVGPARIRSFVVLVDGKPVHRWNDAVRALTGGPEQALVYSSFGRGSVLPAGETLTLLTLPPGDRGLRFWSEGQAREGKARFATIVCYCSIYDECWRTHSEESEPVPVRACAPEGAREFGEE